MEFELVWGLQSSRTWFHALCLSRQIRSATQPCLNYYYRCFQIQTHSFFGYAFPEKVVEPRTATCSRGVGTLRHFSTSRGIFPIFLCRYVLKQVFYLLVSSTYCLTAKIRSLPRGWFGGVLLRISSFGDYYRFPWPIEPEMVCLSEANGSRPVVIG